MRRFAVEEPADAAPAPQKQPEAAAAAPSGVSGAEAMKALGADKSLEFEEPPQSSDAPGMLLLLVGAAAVALLSRASPLPRRFRRGRC